jgi:hypothetical protein
MASTRWLIDAPNGSVCTLELPRGRRVAAGDLVRLSPKLGQRGPIWRVVAVEAEPGYDGRLLVEPATDITPLGR